MNILRRMPLTLLPAAPWNSIAKLDKDTTVYRSFWHKLQVKFSNVFKTRYNFFDFITRKVYMTLFFLLGYIGMFVALLRRQYFVVFLVMFTGIIPAYSCITSHIEYRYVMPFYNLLALFV